MSELIKLPIDWYTSRIAPGVDPNLPGIYEWQIEGVGSFIGRYTHRSRPFKEYERNVSKIINKLPYRPKKKDAFRRVHRELYKAHLEGRQITLSILENCDPSDLNRRKQELVTERGALNSDQSPPSSVPDFPLDEFTHVAVMTLSDDEQTIHVELLDGPAKLWTEVNYVWTSPDNDILRIGTSKQPIGTRLLSYAKDINNRLQRQHGGTPEWEAEEWVDQLGRFGQLTAFVYQPPLVETVAGPVRPYLDIERVLISRYDTPLNRSNR